MTWRSAIEAVRVAKGGSSDNQLGPITSRIARGAIVRKVCVVFHCCAPDCLTGKRFEDEKAGWSLRLCERMTTVGDSAETIVTIGILMQTTRASLAAVISSTWETASTRYVLVPVPTVVLQYYRSTSTVRTGTLSCYLPTYWY